MEAPKTIKTIFSWNADNCGETVEWCPIENYRHIFVCGTYQYDGTISRTEKTGKIYLFSFNKDAKELNPIQVVETAPMFDQKWCQYTVGGKPTLGVVDSFGALKIYSLTVENEIAFLTLISEAVIKNDPLAMTQSLDWSNNKFNSKPSVSISDSFGNVTIVQLDESQDIQTVQSWKAHEKDALICAFDSWNPSTVFTGGSDKKLKIFDTRNTERAQCEIKHDNAVTSLHSNIGKEHILASGSEDEILRVWDIRNTKDALAKLHLLDRIFRLKWEPKKQEMLLATTMNGSIEVLNWNNDSINRLAFYTNYELIISGVHAADWCHDVTLMGSDDAVTSNLIAYCSFIKCVLTVATFT